MVVPKRILVDISFPFHLSTLHNSQELLNNMTMNININTSRGLSTNSSSNSSRASSVHSNVSSTTYNKHVQVLANNPSWAKQVEESDVLVLSYVFLKVRESNNANKAKTLESVPEPYSANIDNMYPWRLEPSVILYSIN